MKKIILTLGFIGSLYANNSLSCESISEQELHKKLLEYKKSMNMNKFQNPENINDINREEMRQHVKQVSFEGKALKQCQLILDIRKYAVTDGRRYKALLSLNYNSLSRAEKRLYDTILKESKSYFSNYSRASVVSKNMGSYPLVYLTMSKSTIYEFREINHKIKRYRTSTNMVNIPFKVGDMQTKQAFISYLNSNHHSNFVLPRVKNNIDVLQGKAKNNIQNFDDRPTPFKILKEDLIDIKSFLKHDKSILITTIPKGAQIKYLYHFKKESVVILYNNRKWTISEKQWNDSTGGF